MTERFVAACAKKAALALVVSGALSGVALGGAAVAAADCVTASGGAVVDCDGTFGESRGGTQQADDRDAVQDAYSNYSPFFAPQYR